MKGIIAVGALGGSGTRAIAQILMQAGIYLGDDLNSANDNLIFTRLFKNPFFYKSANRNEINKRLHVFKKYMVSNHLNIHDSSILIKASIRNPLFKDNKKLFSNILQKYFNSPINRKMWGWKEPNTLIYLKEISLYFNDLKYIHILRHGLDMAFSSNKQQLTNWGFKYDIHLRGNETEDEISYMQLEYWIRSTQEVLKKSKILGCNFLLINHSDFSNHPKAQVDRIIDFLKLEINNEKLSNLYEVPQKTSSLGRYKQNNLNIFDNRQIDFVKDMGFEV